MLGYRLTDHLLDEVSGYPPTTIVSCARVKVSTAAALFSKVVSYFVGPLRGPRVLGSLNSHALLRGRFSVANGRGVATGVSPCAVTAIHPCRTNSGDPLSLTVSQPRSAARSTRALVAAGISLAVLMLLNLSVKATLPAWSRK